MCLRVCVFLHYSAINTNKWNVNHINAIIVISKSTLIQSFWDWIIWMLWHYWLVTYIISMYNVHPIPKKDAICKLLFYLPLFFDAINSWAFTYTYSWRISNNDCWIQPKWLFFTFIFSLNPHCIDSTNKIRLFIFFKSIKFFHFPHSYWSSKHWKIQFQIWITS